MTIRQALAAALLGVGLAATTVAPASAALPDRDQRETLPAPTTATVTAAQLGSDSIIAVVTHGDLEKLDNNRLARSLEVITPDGARHPVYTVETTKNADGWYPGDFVITDWRPELHTALLRVSRGSHGDTLVSYDVTTGATHQVPAPRRVSTTGLNPDGTGVLVTKYANDRSSFRIGTLRWDGVTTWLPGRSEGSAITSVDGRTTISSEGQRWWVTDLATRSSAAIETPGYCVPRRWFDADSVVATCGRARWSQLRLVDLDGTSSWLGIRHTAKTRASGPAVFNDADVRVVQGRSWYESYGGCGGAFLTRQSAAGTVRIVRVPGSTGALSLVGTRGDRLLLAHQKDDCESTMTRGVLTLFDPVSKLETELTRLARDEQWREVFLATEVRVWIW